MSQPSLFGTNSACSKMGGMQHQVGIEIPQHICARPESSPQQEVLAKFIIVKTWHACDTHYSSKDNACKKYIFFPVGDKTRPTRNTSCPSLTRKHGSVTPAPNNEWWQKAKTLSMLLSITQPTTCSSWTEETLVECVVFLVKEWYKEAKTNKEWYKKAKTLKEGFLDSPSKMKPFAKMARVSAKTCTSSPTMPCQHAVQCCQYH